MQKPMQLPLPGFDQARAQWRERYRQQVGNEPPVCNRSGVAIDALYTPEHFDGAHYMRDLGFPGSGPMMAVYCCCCY